MDLDPPILREVYHFSFHVCCWFLIRSRRVYIYTYMENVKEHGSGYSGCKALSLEFQDVRKGMEEWRRS